ncbi:helix-turn-helix transcriptional regulator [Arthrobacter halodurans]|uniref:Response regulator transcription factor n=1 Tax=Arthrobacter halodurans TaxID=516699 RepID=A0ABV4UN46_9MICC
MNPAIRFDLREGSMVPHQNPVADSTSSGSPDQGGSADRARTSASRPVLELPADVRATAELGDVVSSVLIGAAGVEDVLRQLQRIVPYDAAMLSAYDPVKGKHRCLARVGYDDRVASFANTDYLSCPSYRVSVDSSLPMRWRDFPFDFHGLATYADVLQPAGFAEGATTALRRSGTIDQVGMLVMSQRDLGGIDDERRGILSAVAPMLARIVDDRGRLRLLRAKFEPSARAAVVTADGDHRPLDADAARLCQEAPGLIQSAVDMFGTDAVARSGYVFHDGGWWRVVMTRGDDASLPRPEVVVVVAEPGAPPAGLTRRELQVLTLMADGLANAEIASRLVLSVRTVTTHVEHILGKLRRPSRAGCAARTESEGLRLLG